MRINDSLDPFCVTVLDNLGFQWSFFASGIERFVDAKKNGDTIIEGHPCFKWCKEVRRLKREGERTDGQEALLAFSNFEFELKNDSVNEKNQSPTSDRDTSDESISILVGNDESEDKVCFRDCL